MPVSTSPVSAARVLCPGQAPAFRVAAPSWVIRAGLAENCRFLAGLVDEAALLFFESGACLEYGPGDLPEDLSGLPVSYHLHLPLDLPWRDGVPAVADILIRLAELTAHLAPRPSVLHPPATAGELEELAGRLDRAGLSPADYLVENVEFSDLPELWPALAECGFGACLDLGHMLAYGQEAILDLPGLWDRVGMLHVHAPEGGRDRHLSLDRLDRRGVGLLRLMLGRLKPGGTVNLEVFRAADLFSSLRVLGLVLRGAWEGA